MKKILIVLCICFISVLCLCGCAGPTKKAENADLADKIIDNYNAGRTIVEKKINNINNHYQTTYIYLKVEDKYYIIDNQYAGYEIGTGKQFYTVDINTYSNKQGTTCIELIQYANYFEVTLGNYFSQSSDGRWLMNTTEAGQLMTKRLIVSNNIGSYEIRK